MLSSDASGDEEPGVTAGSMSKKGRFQHTYSRRGRKPAAETTSHAVQPRESQHSRVSKTMKLSSKKVRQPGEIVLPTPIVRRARQQVVSPMQQPALPNRALKKGERRLHCTTLDLHGSYNVSKPSSMISALEIEMLPLRYRISPTRFLLYESILRALHALLLVTASPDSLTSSSTISMSATRNTKSLMAMCLRKVPEYIGELEYWEQRDAEEKGTKSTLQNSEVSNEIYEAVEDMLPSSRGCPELRTVLREHGMRVVRKAVVEGLLDDQFSLLLVALCFRMKAYLEAEGLSEVLLGRSFSKPKGIDSTFDESRSLAPLRTLRDLARESGRPQFMLRQLSKLMTTHQLPIDWLSTKEFASIWSGIVKTLSGDAVCDDTVSCAVHMITLLSSQAKLPAFTLRPGKGDLKTVSQQTLISAITALTSFPLLRQDAGARVTHYSAKNTAYAISARVGYIIEACLYDIKKTRKSVWISTVLDLSAHFLNTTQARSTTHLSDVWHRVLQDCNKRDGKQNYEAATAFLCSLARCCSQGAAEPSHHYLIKFCDELDSMASVQGGKSRQIRTDCAFLLAERTNDMRDLAFAETFNDNAGSPESKAVKHTERKRSSTSAVTGFRWDGDISEWVTATPAPQARRFSTQAQEWSRESAAEICNAETYGDSGGSELEASSANRHGHYKGRLRQRWTRSSVTRANRCTQQQGSAMAPSTRKRNSSVAGLLGLQSSDEETEKDEEDGETPQPRRKHQQRGNGQENKISAVLVADAKKRRLMGDVTPLKPRRAILRTITNTGHADLSDDELGL